MISGKASTLRCPASVIASIPIEIVVHHGIFASALISSVSFLGFALFRQSSTIPVSVQRVLPHSCHMFLCLTFIILSSFFPPLVLWRLVLWRWSPSESLLSLPTDFYKHFPLALLPHISYCLLRPLA